MWVSLYSHLRQIPILDMDAGHAVQPGFAQFRSAGVRLGQTVLQVHQHLWISLMLLHLSCGHQDCTDSLCQVFHVRWKSGVLQEPPEHKI